MTPRRALGALLLPLPGVAAAAEPEARRLAGGTLVEMAAASGISLPLRGAARGRQQMVYEGLRLPGPPVALVADRWLVGWGCGDADAAAAGCVERGLFLAFDLERERLFLMLVAEGEPVYLAPPRTGLWPQALAESFAQFAPGLPHGPRFEE